MPTAPPLCRFGDCDAMVRVDLSDGCIAYPTDREQDLCINHYHWATPLGRMGVIGVYQPETYEWYKQQINSRG